MLQPLHIAVKRENPTTVRLLLQAKAPAFLLRDLSGQTPLHLAVHKYLHDIVRLVGDAGPEEAFAMEDCVGNTPLEVAVTNWLHVSTGNKYTGVLPNVQDLNDNVWWAQTKRDIPTAKDATELAATVARLLEQGRLRAGTRLANALQAFATRVREASEGPKDTADEEEGADAGADAEFADTDAKQDATATLDYVAGVVAAKPALRRQLVHLIDVHKSVQGSLDKSATRQEQVQYYRHRKNDDEGGLDPEVEEDKEKTAKDHSAIKMWASSLDVFGDDPY